MVDWAQLNDYSMLDLIRSCDVLLTKPGYGAFTEAACNGTSVLYVARDDWPEEPWLSRWLVAHGFRTGIEIAFPQTDLHLRTAPALENLAAPHFAETARLLAAVSERLGALEQRLAGRPARPGDEPDKGNTP